MLPAWPTVSAARSVRKGARWRIGRFSTAQAVARSSRLASSVSPTAPKAVKPAWPTASSVRRAPTA